MNHPNTARTASARRWLLSALSFAFALSCLGAAPSSPLGKFKIVDGAAATAQWGDQTVTLEKGKTYAAAATITIQTPKSGGLTTLLFSNGITAFLDAGAVLEIDEFKQSGTTRGPVSPEQSASKTRFSLLEGSAFFVPGRMHADSTFSVQTPGGTIKSRGNFYIRQSSSTTHVAMQSGTAAVWLLGASLEGAPSRTLGQEQQMALPRAGSTVATSTQNVAPSSTGATAAPGGSLDGEALSPFAEIASHTQNSDFGKDDEVVVLGNTTAPRDAGAAHNVASGAAAAGGEAGPVAQDLLIYLSRLAQGIQDDAAFEADAPTVTLGQPANDSTVRPNSTSPAGERNAPDGNSSGNASTTPAGGATDGSNASPLSGGNTSQVPADTLNYLNALADNAALDETITGNDDRTTVILGGPSEDARATGAGTIAGANGNAASDTSNNAGGGSGANDGTGGVPSATSDYLNSLVDSLSGGTADGAESNGPVIALGGDGSGPGAGGGNNSTLSGDSLASNSNTGSGSASGSGATDGTGGVPPATSDYLNSLVDSLSGGTADGAGGSSGAVIALGGDGSGSGSGAGSNSTLSGDSLASSSNTGSGSASGSGANDGTGSVPPATVDYLNSLADSIAGGDGSAGANGSTGQVIALGDNTGTSGSGSGTGSVTADPSSGTGDGTGSVPPVTSDYLDTLANNAPAGSDGVAGTSGSGDSAIALGGDGSGGGAGTGGTTSDPGTGGIASNPGSGTGDGTQPSPGAVNDYLDNLANVGGDIQNNTPASGGAPTIPGVVAFEQPPATGTVDPGAGTASDPGTGTGTGNGTPTGPATDTPPNDTPIDPIIIIPPETIDPGKIVSPAVIPPQG